VAERDSLRSLVPSLAPHDRDALLSSFARAINSGQLRIETQGAPL
jgi:hypothetical protein